MRRIVLTGATILAFVSSSAIAQTTATPAAAPTSAVSKDLAAEKPLDAPGQAAAKGSDAGDMFMSVPANHELSSQLVGLTIYNKDKANIGEIKDIVIVGASVKAYIIGVGGFLGMGDRYVAVQPSAIALTYDAGAKIWHAVMDVNADSLKAAPQYKYAS